MNNQQLKQENDQLKQLVYKLATTHIDHYGHTINYQADLTWNYCPETNHFTPAWRKVRSLQPAGLETPTVAPETEPMTGNEADLIREAHKHEPKPNI